MTSERKAELFDEAMGYIYGTLQYDYREVVEEVLESIGFTDEEIKKELENTMYGYEYEEEGE